MFLPARPLQLPVRIINSKSRWVKVYCGAQHLWRPASLLVSHWSKPPQTDGSDWAFLLTSALIFKTPGSLPQDNLTRTVCSSHGPPRSSKPKCFTLYIDQIWMVEHLTGLNAWQTCGCEGQSASPRSRRRFSIACTFLNCGLTRLLCHAFSPFQIRLQPNKTCAVNACVYE